MTKDYEVTSAMIYHDLVARYNTDALTAIEARRYYQPTQGMTNSNYYRYADTKTINLLDSYYQPYYVSKLVDSVLPGERFRKTINAAYQSLWRVQNGHAGAYVVSNVRCATRPKDDKPIHLGDLYYWPDYPCIYTDTDAGRALQREHAGRMAYQRHNGDILSRRLLSQLLPLGYCAEVERQTSKSYYSL